MVIKFSLCWVDSLQHSGLLHASLNFMSLSPTWACCSPPHVSGMTSNTLLCQRHPHGHFSHIDRIPSKVIHFQNDARDSVLIYLHKYSSSLEYFVLLSAIFSSYFPTIFSSYFPTIRLFSFFLHHSSLQIKNQKVVWIHQNYPSGFLCEAWINIFSLYFSIFIHSSLKFYV